MMKHCRQTTRTTSWAPCGPRCVTEIGVVHDPLIAPRNGVGCRSINDCGQCAAKVEVFRRVRACYKMDEARW